MQHSLCIIDDDEVMRDALQAFLTLEGYAVECFESGAHFLSTMHANHPACVILDMQMPGPGPSGQEILAALRDQGFAAPIVMVAEQPDVNAAVEAMKSGAADFVEKPFEMTNFISRIREAIASHLPRQNTADPAAMLREMLTPREREVLKEITDGASNKEFGRRLGISPRTVEVHRARIMEKLNAKNAADLVRIVLNGKK